MAVTSRSWAARACGEVRKAMAASSAALPAPRTWPWQRTRQMPFCSAAPRPHRRPALTALSPGTLMMGHSRAPAAQLLHGAAEVLVLHHIPALLCSLLRETVLLLALRGENEPHPKFPAYTKNKNEKLLHGWAQVPARDGLWAERVFLQGRTLV